MVTDGPGEPPNTWVRPSASMTFRVPTFTKDFIMLERGNIGGSMTVGSSLALGFWSVAAARPSGDRRVPVEG
jgi:hypothetical protein